MAKSRSKSRSSKSRKGGRKSKSSRNSLSRLGLNYSVSVLVPSTTKKSKKITKAQFNRRIANTKKSLNSLFGGSTTTRATGSFTSSKRKLINEKIAVVTSHTNKKGFARGSPKLSSFLKGKKKAWKQESIGATVETPNRPSKSFLFV